MPISILILSVLASAAQSDSAQQGPVIVTGHAWAPFISPMGEPFRSRAVGDDTLADWFRQADRNRDGVLTADEMVADADRFFATLDTNGDGQIDPDELVHYEWQVAPEIQLASRTRSPRGGPSVPDEGSSNRRDRDRSKPEKAPQGAARYALLNLPEPVAAADADFNRAISRDEFRQAALERFALLDKRRQGKLTLADLEGISPAQTASNAKRQRDATDLRVGSPLPPGK
jgi:Ca2+-binding EF-hand superfamily protein